MSLFSRQIRLATRQPAALLGSVRFNSNASAAGELVGAIRTALKDSMRAKDTFKSGVLKSALGEIQTASYAAEGQSAPSPDKTLSKSIKKRQEAIETFLTSGREDLAKTYESELDILKAFVSEQATLSAEELEGVVKATLQKLGLDQGDKQAMGKLIKGVKEVLPEVDGKQLAQTAKKVLSA